MTAIHNITDLKAIYLLEQELLAVRNELRKAPGYDPTESLAENVEIMVSVGKYFTDRTSALRRELNELKKEQENDKEVARSYPLTGRTSFCVAADVPTAKIFSFSGSKGPCE